MKNLRLIITSIIGLALLAVAFMIFKNISTRKKSNRQEVKVSKAGVFTEIVKNEMKPLIISANGNLKAKDRIELYAEVQGVFEKSRRIFKAGSYYRKGELLVKINNKEHLANLQVQKSNLYQRLIGILPDLKLDYPQHFTKWDDYIKAFDVTQHVQALPEFEDDQEKLFISGKGIVSAYYIVKNLQERLGKYNIYAPFNGILTMANVTKGTLIRPGQKLGSFINTNIFELEVSVNSAYTKYMKIGNEVKLSSIDGHSNWVGKLTRINGLVDQRTQSSSIFIEVSDKELKEGMYLQAEIAANESKNVFELDRSLLLEDNLVYIIKSDSIMTSIKVIPVHYNEKTVFVEGLDDNTIFVNRFVPGAFDGKIVNIIED